MGLLDCLSMLTIVGEDAKRELLEHFRLSHDIAEKDVEAFVQNHVPLRSCRWRIMTGMWRMFQRQVKVLTNHGVKLWCDHCSLPAVVNWSFATGSWSCGSCGPQLPIIDMDCWLPHFCQLRKESQWSKFDEDDAGFYEEWTEEKCLERFLLLWVGRERCEARAEAEDDCDENVSIASLVKKMNLEERSRTTAIGTKECGGKENHNVIPRILRNGNGHVSRRRVERGTAPVSADESDC